MEEEKKSECSTCSNEPSGRINVMRFVDRLDAYLRNNDLEGAKKHLEFWENEARSMNDQCGLLTILNEEIGFSRRVNDRKMAADVLDEALNLLKEREQFDNTSGAIICVNIATTLKAFDRSEEALAIYDKAERVFLDRGMEESFEYASLLNNRSSALTQLQRYDEAEEDILKAYDILVNEGRHDAEIASSLIGLAHLVFERDEDYVRVEKTLDIAIEYLESEKQVHDANYAYTLEKIIPSLRYFKRNEIADRYEKIVKEIYGKQ